MKQPSRLAAFSLILLLAASGCGVNQASTPRAASPSATATALAARVDATVEAQAALPVVKALSGAVLVVKDGQVILNKGYGFADRQHRISNTPSTAFQIASISKQFVAVAILILQQRHQLSVHDRICTYIPGCPASWRPITIHMLLTHTSGIGHTDDSYLSLDATPMSLDQLVSLYERMPPLFKPGTQYHYTSPGYTLLACIVQKVSGEPYATFLHKNVFGPLGMTRTKVDDTNHPPDGHAVGYLGLYPRAYPSLIGVFGSGDIWTTTGDLERWDQSFSTTRILSKASQQAMFTSWILVPGSNGDSYGYGWQIEYGKTLLIYHDGGNPGFSVYNSRLPNDKVDVIVLTNNEIDRSGLVTDIEVMALGMG